MPRHTAAERLAIERRRARVAEKLLHGRRQYEIAEEEQCDPATISRDIAAIREELRTRSAKDLAEAKIETLEKIALLERVAWSAWHESKLPGRPGDPRYLRVVQDCFEERCKILGLYAPEKRSWTDPRGEKEAAFIRAALMSDDTREILAVLTDRLGGLETHQQRESHVSDNGTGPHPAGDPGSNGHASG
jgi:hypothetical protein